MILLEKYLMVCQSWLDSYVDKLSAISEIADVKNIKVLGVDIEVPDVLDSVVGDTARINITGVMSQSGPSRLDLLYGEGGVSYSEIQKAFISADEGLKNNVGENGGTIFAFANTPGGTVTGLGETRSVIADVATRRKVIFVNAGMMTSGGEFLASAAHDVFATSNMSIFGSIGVVTSKIDASKLYEKLGITNYSIVSSNAGSKVPDVSTEAGRSLIRGTLDEIESVFYDAMTEYKGITRETLMSTDGGIFLNKKAMKLGFSSGLFDARIGAEKKEENKTTPVVHAGSEENISMDLEKFLAQNPAAKAEYDARLKQQFEAGVAHHDKEVKVRVEKAKSFLMNENYSKKVRGVAAGVVCGDITVEGLNLAVMMSDEKVEKGKSDEASTETEDIGGTPSGGPIVNSETQKLAEETRVLQGYLGINVGE